MNCLPVGMDERCFSACLMMLSGLMSPKMAMAEFDAL